MLIQNDTKSRLPDIERNSFKISEYVYTCMCFFFNAVFSRLLISISCHFVRNQNFYNYT